MSDVQFRVNIMESGRLSARSQSEITNVETIAVSCALLGQPEKVICMKVWGSLSITFRDINPQFYTFIGSFPPVCFKRRVHMCLPCAHVFAVCTCVCRVHMCLPCTHVFAVYTCVCRVHMCLPCAHVFAVCTCVCHVHVCLTCTHVFAVCTYVCRVHMCLQCVHVFAVCTCVWSTELEGMSH
jgi:hypothetical protein